MSRHTMWKDNGDIYFLRLPFCACAVLLNLLLSSCTVGPDFKPPKAPCTDSYTCSDPISTIASIGPGGQAQRFRKGEDIPNEWWKVFRSKSLNCLIRKGIANSPTLAAGLANLNKAREDLNAEAGALLFPAVTGQLGAQRQRFSASSFGNTTAPPSTFSLYNAQVNVTYGLDFFGKNRRILEGLASAVDYQGFQLEAAHLTLASNIVTAAIKEATLRAQIKATKSIIQSYTEVLNITQKQFELGSISYVDVLAQIQQLATIKATLPPLEKSLAQTRHALSVLVGDLPSDCDIPKFELENFRLPTELPISLPSTLVCQRPDIKASVALLHQANANIGVATANLFPSITLSGYYGAQANKLGNLFHSGSNIWEFGGQLLQPIFKGGSLRAQRRAAVYAFDAAFANYKQTVLLAFQNVADTLRALEIDAKALKLETDALNASLETKKLIEIQYRDGAAGYLALLIAQRRYQEILISSIQARANRLTDTAALFQALGGGWWNCGCN